jgi:hypothetical protein
VGALVELLHGVCVCKQAVGKLQETENTENEKRGTCGCSCCLQCQGSLDPLRLLMDDSTLEPLDSFVCPKGPLSPRITSVQALRWLASAVSLPTVELATGSFALPCLRCDKTNVLGSHRTRKHEPDSLPLGAWTHSRASVPKHVRLVNIFPPALRVVDVPGVPQFLCDVILAMCSLGVSLEHPPRVLNRVHIMDRAFRSWR